MARRRLEGERPEGNANCAEFLVQALSTSEVKTLFLLMSSVLSLRKMRLWDWRLEGQEGQEAVQQFRWVRVSTEVEQTCGVGEERLNCRPDQGEHGGGLVLGQRCGRRSSHAVVILVPA